MENHIDLEPDILLDELEALWEEHGDSAQVEALIEAHPQHRERLQQHFRAILAVEYRDRANPEHASATAHAHAEAFARAARPVMSAAPAEPALGLVVLLVRRTGKRLSEIARLLEVTPQFLQGLERVATLPERAAAEVARRADTVLHVAASEVRRALQARQAAPMTAFRAADTPVQPPLSYAELLAASRLDPAAQQFWRELE